jgi:hypothetical protein
MRVIPLRFTTCLAALAVLCNSLACICSGISNGARVPAAQTAARHGHPGCHAHVRHDADAGESGHGRGKPDQGDPKCEHCRGAFSKASQATAKPNLVPTATTAISFVPEALPITGASVGLSTRYASGDPPVPPDFSLLRQHCALNS